MSICQQHAELVLAGAGRAEDLRVSYWHPAEGFGVTVLFGVVLGCDSVNRLQGPAHPLSLPG